MNVKPTRKALFLSGYFGYMSTDVAISRLFSHRDVFHLQTAAICSEFRLLNWFLTLYSGKLIFWKFGTENAPPSATSVQDVSSKQWEADLSSAFKSQQSIWLARYIIFFHGTAGYLAQLEFSATQTKHMFETPSAYLPGILFIIINSK